MFWKRSYLHDKQEWERTSHKPRTVLFKIWDVAEENRNVHLRICAGHRRLLASVRGETLRPRPSTRVVIRGHP